MFKFLKNLFRKPARSALPPAPGVEVTYGNEIVYVALTPEQAREVHDRAMSYGLPHLAAQVETLIPYGGKARMTVTERSLTRRILEDPKVGG